MCFMWLSWVILAEVPLHTQGKWVPRLSRCLLWKCLSACKRSCECPPVFSNCDLGNSTKESFIELLKYARLRTFAVALLFLFIIFMLYSHYWWSKYLHLFRFSASASAKTKQAVFNLYLSFLQPFRIFNEFCQQKLKIVKIYIPVTLCHLDVLDIC